MTSQTFCYLCVEYIKLDTCAKLHDHQKNNKKVMMGEGLMPSPLPWLTGQKSPCQIGLTEIGVETSTQTETGGLTLRELQGLDKEMKTMSGSLRSTIAKSIAEQVDIDKEKQKLDEMANDETYSDEQREEVRDRLQRFQDEQKAINDQISCLKGRYSNQINQIRESITKFLDKET